MLFIDPPCLRMVFIRPNDISFGARGPLREQDLAGYNSFILFHKMDKRSRAEILTQIQSWASKKKPTRVVLIAPREDVEPLLRPFDRKFLELATSDDNFPFMHRSTFRSDTTRSSKPISIVLVLNKESMLVDPINWPSLKRALLNGPKSNVHL